MFMNGRIGRKRPEETEEFHETPQSDYPAFI
jgi:hypothetical protein